jgi:hypothetical protein
MEKGGTTPRGPSFLGHGWLKSAHYTDADSDADAHVGNQMTSEVSFVGAIGEPGLTTPRDKVKEMCRKHGQGTRPTRPIQNPLAAHSLDPGTGFEQYANVSSIMLLNGTTAMSLDVTPRMIKGLGPQDCDNVQNHVEPSLPNPVPHSDKEKVQRSAQVCPHNQLGAPGPPTRHYFEDLIQTMTTGSHVAQSKGPQDCDDMENKPSLPKPDATCSAAWIQRSYCTFLSLLDLVSAVSQEFARLLLQANLAHACLASPSVECPFPEIQALSW